MLRTPLYLSSICLFILAACSPATGYKFSKIIRDTPAYLAPQAGISGIHYKASLRVLNRTFGGLLIVKQGSDSITRFSFITEVGMKMFEYKASADSLTREYVFEPLNHPDFLTLIEKDLRFAFLYQYLDSAQLYTKNQQLLIRTFEDRPRYISIDNMHRPLFQVEKGRIFWKTRIRYAYPDSAAAGAIRIRNNGVPAVELKLHKIEKLQ